MRVRMITGKVRIGGKTANVAIQTTESFPNFVTYNDKVEVARFLQSKVEDYFSNMEKVPIVVDSLSVQMTGDDDIILIKD